jgi:membrane protease subunit HflK
MAWNQPGGDKSPWGRRPGQGGSDLDERVKSWQRKLEALFRPGGQSSDGGGSGASLVLTIALAALGLWLLNGFFQVGAAERGIIQRFGKLVAVRQQGWGWRWPWPIESITKVNVLSVNSKEYKPRVLTADVNLVELRFVVQYRLADPTKVLFRVADPEGTLKEVSESAIREIIGQSELQDVLAGATRPQITQRTRTLIQHNLDYYNTGIEVSSVNLTDVQVPEAVVPSQRDANKALADQERAVKEAQAYASSVLPAAQGYAAKTQQDAQAYKARVEARAEGQAARFSELAAAYARAPEVTRERMYLDTMEQVFSRANKVIVDSKPGATGGNLIYLPLDKIMGRGAGNAAGSDSQQPESTARPAPEEPDTVTVEGRSRGER